MTLTDLFDASLVGRADCPALEFERADGIRVELTFGEVSARAARMTTALQARGLRAGDRCVVHLANSPEFIDLFLACVRLEVLFVPVNVLYRGRELAHIVADSEPALVVTSDEHRDLFAADVPVATSYELAKLSTDQTEQAATAATSAELTTVHADHTGTAGLQKRAAADESAPAVIIYTSGTTGRAKGAVLSRGNLAANAQNLVSAWRISSDDRYLAVLPLFHVHGLGNGICSWLASGCRMRLVERFDHLKAATWFDDFRPTMFFGVPTVYIRMLEWPREVCARIGATMRLFVSGSAPLPAPVLEAFRDQFTHTILERYGMSETLMNISNPYDGERRPGSVGLPLPGVEVRLVDATGAAVPMDTVAQLEVRGPNVFSRYWRSDDATAAAFRDGWFRTGDMAERAADGYVTLRGRATDLIISGGFNIYPREIEELLLEQPGVREAAVVGAADTLRGEVPIAYVVMDTDTTAAAGDGGAEARGLPADESLRAACAASLASFKVPRAFIRMDSLPRTALGKIQRHLLPPWVRP